MCAEQHITAMRNCTRRPPTGDVRKHGYHIFSSPLLVAKIVVHRGRVEIPVVFAIRAATVFAQPALPPFARHKACATGGPSTRAGTPRLTKDAIAAAKIGCAIIGMIRVGVLVAISTGPSRRSRRRCRSMATDVVCSPITATTDALSLLTIGAQVALRVCTVGNTLASRCAQTCLLT